MQTSGPSLSCPEMPPARQRTFSKADTAAGSGPKRPVKRTGSLRANPSFSSKSTSSKNAPPVASRTEPNYPKADIAFKAFLSARICAALWAHITDCDETFNYWEPLHYLVYGQGLQTWEYSPEFALRSFTYLLIHGVPAFVYNSLFKSNPTMVFYFVRITLGISCSLVELYFYKAVSREFGIQIGRLWLMFQLFAPGMFIASTALLPSSFSMYLGSAALAAWWNQRYRLAVFLIAISTLLGWPFAALIGLPICYDMLVRQRLWRTFIIWSVISAVTIGIPMVVIDSSYFGKLTVAPLNIVLYNVFSSHGPNLYGTEPLSFYLINGFLNFNIIWLLALITPIILVIGHFLIPAKAKPTLFLPYYVSLSPFYLWLIVFLAQPHKEERFLFPVYFMVALCGAISIDTIQKLFFRLKCALFPVPAGTHYLTQTAWISAIVMIITTLLGLSKIASLQFNYHGPLDVFLDLNTLHRSPDSPIQPNTTYNVCVGKDWYRFPASFFLPNDQYRVRFLKSEFDGMLPSYFDPSPNGAATVNPHFNDANRGAPEMLFDYDRCHFLLDLDTGRYSELEPNYAARVKDWSVLRSVPFLDAQQSHPFFRTFWVPFVGDDYVKYGSLNLLQRDRFSLVRDEE